MSAFTQDLRHSLRVMRKNPGFTAIAVAALALGIGANTAIFSVVNGVLLRPLSFKDPDRLVRVGRNFRGKGVNATSLPKYFAWRSAMSAFEGMAIYDFTGPGLNLSGSDRAEQVKGIHVSSEFFTVFGTAPFRGRTFTETEDRPGGPKLAVISYGLWQRRWAANPAILGQPMTLNGEPFTVIGILPENFHSDPPADIFIPMQADPNSQNQGNYLRMSARLKTGVSLDAARAQLKVAGEQFRRQYPTWMDKEEGVAVVPEQEAVIGDTRPALLILMGAVGLVLLIACANVANLLLARSTGRAREIAVRTALGAGRLRIVRQLLTESVLLALAGGVAGLAIGLWGARALLAITPADLPRVAEMIDGGLLATLDLRMLAFTLGVSVLTGVLFGLVPALQVSRTDVSSTLKESGSRSATGRHHFARGALVVGEMALSLVLLVGAVLLIRTFISLRSVNPGFDPRHVLTFQTSLSGERYATTARVAELTRRALDRLESLPGVEAATSSFNAPLETGIDLPFNIDGRQPPKDSPYNGESQYRYAAPHYFSALKIPVLRGRVFTYQDSGTAPRVAVVNAAMVRKYWPNEDPIGRRITIGKGIGPQFDDPPRQIVGVVGDVHEEGLDNDASEVIYVPFAQVPDGISALANSAIPTVWLVRTTPQPLTLDNAVRQEFLSIESDLPLAKIRTMEQVIGESTARQSFQMILLAVFASIALVLAALGIYGVMSYVVEQRTHEIGIRLSLGAGTGDMVRLIVGQGMRLAAIGVACGLAAAFALTRLLEKLLFGVKATDPVTYALVAALLAVVALLATYIPAHRATRIDPVIALRYE
ncbi:MAG TPA: ABC transporter permease [Bryobacteraceae bacterium]|nr:ABC transporter permease [Bryobacteraceae bacterium]